MPEAERAVALNLRSHNPKDVKMVIEVQTYVDNVLGITGKTFFKSSDEFHIAALKGIRNILASQVKNKWISRWFFTKADGHTRVCFAAYLDGLYASPRVRLLQAAGFTKSLVLFLLLLAKRLKGLAEVGRGIVLRCRDLLARDLAFKKDRDVAETAPDSSRQKRPPVFVLTSLIHQIVNFTVKSVVDQLRKQNINAVLVFHDGFDPRKFRSNENGRWCGEMGCVTLEAAQGSILSWTAVSAAPRHLFQTVAAMVFCLKRVFKATGEDWGMRWLLLRKVPGLILGFQASLLRAKKLLAQFQPASVLNCDNGSENLHVKAFAYLCLKQGLCFYRYKPVPTFPVRQPVFNSVSRLMLATANDAAIFSDNGAVPEFWDVGSPILDLAAPFILRTTRKTSERNGGGRERMGILFFTKRDFPNHGVISAVSEYCEENRLPVRLTVKFHPSDSKQFVLDQPSPDGLVKVVCYRKEEIEQVDQLIFEADIVISGSSNVIWSAFAQFKPVVYLGFKDMSTDGHVSGYGRYATSDFIVAFEPRDVGNIVGRLLDKIRKGEASKHLDHHDSLMRNFFCSGEFNSKERICRVLVDRA